MMLPAVSGGPSWTRTRSQWTKNAASANAKPAFSNDFAGGTGSEKATKRPETTHFGHGVQNEKAVVPRSSRRSCFCRTTTRPRTKAS